MLCSVEASLKTVYHEIGEKVTINKDSFIVCAGRHKRRKEGMPHRHVWKFEIGDAAKIIVSSGTTGTQVEITDTESIRYITDNINGLTYSKGEKVNSDGWSYALILYDKDGNEQKKLTVLNEHTVIFDGRYYEGMEADYEIDLTYLAKLFED